GDALGEADAVEALRTLLDLSVRQHLVSDVPLGVFLSGGIDSSAVAAFAARHFPGRLKTFSIGFEDPSFDETSHARGVARALDTDHHEEILGPRVALDLVARLPELLDEPLGDASLLPTFLLSRFTRRSVTVALSGDGGDELFAGYPTYQAHRLARALELVPHWVRRGLLRMLYLGLKGYLGEGVLAKVDRASMACSLEVRVPLLDRRVVELAASLPMRLKLRGFTTKYVLKRALSGVLPREVLERRKKG